MNVTAAFAPDDDQRVREHGGAVGVQVRQRLQRQLDLRRRRARRGTSRPCGTRRAAPGTSCGRSARASAGARSTRSGCVARGRVQVAEDDALARERRIEVREHGVGVVLDLQAGALADRAGRGQHVARHVVEVRGPAARRERREVRGRSPTGPCSATPRSPATGPAAPRTRRSARSRSSAGEARRRPGSSARACSSNGVDSGDVAHVDVLGQPTEPSICSSIRRLSSTAYSIGSSRVIGSMKPFTIIAVASTSESPRLIR